MPFWHIPWVWWYVYWHWEQKVTFILHLCFAIMVCQLKVFWPVPVWHTRWVWWYVYWYWKKEFPFVLQYCFGILLHQLGIFLSHSQYDIYVEYDGMITGIRNKENLSCCSNTSFGLCWNLTPWFTVGIDTKIEVIVVSPTTWETHHSWRVKPDHCGELPRSPRWLKSRYQFLFYRDASKHIKFMQIRVCISRKSVIKLLQISHYGKHGHRALSQQPP